MKHKSKRNFEKFAKRERARRNSSRAALARTVSELGVRADHAVIVDKSDRVLRRMNGAHETSFVSAVGIFSGSRSGFGFVKIEGVEKDVFIPSDKTQHALDGDTVEILYRRYTDRMGEEKTEGRVTKILEYGHKTIIGTLVKNRTYSSYRASVRCPYALLPDDRRITMDIGIQKIASAHLGDKVMVRVCRGTYPLTGEILCSFGEAESKEANYAAILAEEGIETDFSAEALAEAERTAADTSILDGRRDLSHLVTFTIDGEGAKDLDDAISLRRLSPDKYRLFVHIADVSSYIPQKSALEREAFSRGTSVYFTDRVVPMLPPVLSNGVCSLHPGEKKAALSAILDLDKQGNLLGCTVERTLIQSRVRGVYSEVNDLYEKGKNSPHYAKYRTVYNTLLRMRELYDILKKKSVARGAVDMEGREARILLDASGIPIDILPIERGIGERMIEQFMLAANEGVATLMRELSLPSVYRIHDNPAPEKMEEFLRYLNSLDIRTGTTRPDSVSGRELCSYLESARERGVEESVSYVLLRSMAKAKYSDKCTGHFGLALHSYCHFTSPIRRLGDLCVHRILNRVLLGGEPAARYTSYARRGAAAATDAELRAVSAERRIENLYKVIFMEERIGEVFAAKVASVTSFGVFVTLENTCEGLIPLSSLTGLYHYDEHHMRLVSTARTYSVGDTVEVRLEEADRIRGKLAFSDTRDPRQDWRSWE